MQKWLQYYAELNHVEHEGRAFLRHIITLDATWAKSYESKMKRQSDDKLHYDFPCKSLVCKTTTNVIVRVILKYDCQSVILVHIVHSGNTVNFAVLLFFPGTQPTTSIGE